MAVTQALVAFTKHRVFEVKAQEAVTQSISGSSPSGAGPSNKTCYMSNRMGHVQRYCRAPEGHITAVKWFCRDHEGHTEQDDSDGQRLTVLKQESGQDTKEGFY